MAFDLYRETMPGALEEMMEAGTISQDLAVTVCKTFDASMLEALRTHVNGKATIKANLKTYRYLDGIWQFHLEKVNLKISSVGVNQNTHTAEVECEKAKLVCVDSALAPEDPATAAANEAAAAAAPAAADK